jgi:protein-tyrosine kinase
MSRIHEALKRAEEEARANSSAAISSLEEDRLLGDVSADPTATAEFSAQNGITVPIAAAASTRGLEPADDWVARIQPKPWNPDPKRLLFSDRNQHYELGMEEFRTLRARLYQLREKVPIKTIMVASALPNEGKTFVSSNLAYVLVRQHGRRVLIIDGDVRKPHMHESLGTSNQPGLIDYLAGAADEAAIMQRGPLENLFLIPGGASVSNPSELISNGRMQVLLDKLGRLFDWIIIDSPPVVPISDGSMMARLADGVLLVIRAGSTAVEVALRAKEELKGGRLLGVVLNRSGLKPTYSSYYYRYGSMNGSK